MRLTSWMDSATTTNSEKVADSLVARRIVSDEKMRVIYNGVDMRRVRSIGRSRGSVREELKVLESDFLWLAVGRLDEPKDYPTMLKAFSRLRSGTHARLVVAGDGPLRASLTLQIRQLGLTQTVTLLGARSDVPDLLAASDALALSSAHEGMPNAVMEALSAALPVVATDVGGVRELVKDRRFGFIVPPGSPERFSGAMAEMMSLQPEERHHMGASGRAFVSRRFDTEVVADEWEKLMLEFVVGMGEDA